MVKAVGQLDYVTVERTGAHVALVRFDRGTKLNAFDGQLILELTEVARNLQDDLDLRAIVLTGGGAYFSSGADLQDLGARSEEGMSDAERRRVYFRGVRLCEAWEALPQVTIAAMEGPAVGAGVALPLACDWRVLAEGGYLYVPEVRVGLNLQWGALPRLVNLVGPARAKRICILCEKMAPEQALDWGLVDATAAQGRSVAVALELAERAAAMPVVATQMIKEGVNAIAGALNRLGSFADADQSQLSASLGDAREARRRFAGKK